MIRQILIFLVKERIMIFQIVIYFWSMPKQKALKCQDSAKKAHQQGPIYTSCNKLVTFFTLFIDCSYFICIGDYNLWDENTKDNIYLRCVNKWNTWGTLVMFVVVLANLTILTPIDYILATNSPISCNKGVTS